MKLKVNLISKTSELSGIESEWNSLVSRCCQNPFLLSGFIKQFMEFNSQKGWLPLVLAFSTEKRLVGTASLRVKRQFGIKFVKFLIRNWFSPDFVIEDEYREVCIQQILKFLFNEFRCQFAEFVLPHHSKNLDSLKKSTRNLALFFAIRAPSLQWSDMRHSVIPVNESWEKFIKSRRNFRRRLRKIEKSLNKLGIWRIRVFGNEEIDRSVLDGILEIESKSWKQIWRIKKRITEDYDLSMILNGAMETSEQDENFKWQVWFLEVDGLNIAYSLVLIFKQTAYIVKTSYDKNYRKYYPGIFINNAAIQDLFRSGNIKVIDWLTDLEFHRNWTSLSLPRVKVLISRRKLPVLFGYTYTSDFIRGILAMIPLTGEKLVRRDLHFL